MSFYNLLQPPQNTQTRYSFETMGRILFISILLDLIDYLAVPMMPVIGDLIDLFSTYTFYYFTRNLGFSFITLVELIPGFDVFPTYSVSAIIMFLTWK